MTEQTIQKMIALLKEHGWKIAAAESCTGGLLSAAITSAPGASEVFEGSIISYANRIKQALLGVDGQILYTCGALQGRGAARPKNRWALFLLASQQTKTRDRLQPKNFILPAAGQKFGRPVWNRPSPKRWQPLKRWLLPFNAFHKRPRQGRLIQM